MEILTMQIHIWNDAPNNPRGNNPDLLKTFKTMCSKVVAAQYLAEPAISPVQVVRRVNCVFCKDELARRIAALDVACPPTPAGQEFVYHQLALLKRYLSGS